MYLISMILHCCKVADSGSRPRAGRSHSFSKHETSENKKKTEHNAKGMGGKNKFSTFKTSSFFKNSFHFIEQEQNTAEEVKILLSLGACGAWNCDGG